MHCIRFPHTVLELFLSKMCFSTHKYYSTWFSRRIACVPTQSGYNHMSSGSVMLNFANLFVMFPHRWYANATKEAFKKSIKIQTSQLSQEVVVCYSRLRRSGKIFKITTACKRNRKGEIPISRTYLFFSHSNDAEALPHCIFRNSPFSVGGGEENKFVSENGGNLVSPFKRLLT